MEAEDLNLQRLEEEAMAKLVAHREALQTDSVSLLQAADITGIDVRRLRHLIERGDVLAFSVEGDLRIPTWQLQRSPISPTVSGATELAAVFPGDLADLSDWIQRSNIDLEGRSPAEALKQGDATQVLALARAIGAAGR